MIAHFDFEQLISHFDFEALILLYLNSRFDFEAVHLYLTLVLDI